MIFRSRKPEKSPPHEDTKNAAQTPSQATHKPSSAAKPSANGPAAEPTAQQRAIRARGAAAASLRLTTALGQMMSILMRSKQFREMKLVDAESMVAPALLSNQFVIANARSNEKGFIVPAAVVLWAQVSAEVDQRLSKNLEQPIRLAPKEWKGGDIPWLIAAIGDPRGIGAIIQQLHQKALKGKPLKVRRKGEDGKYRVDYVAARQPQPKVAKS